VAPKTDVGEALRPDASLTKAKRDADVGLGLDLQEKQQHDFESRPMKTFRQNVQETIANTNWKVSKRLRGLLICGVFGELHFVVPITETTSTGGFGANPP
jgi:hypothetical protein